MFDGFSLWHMLVLFLVLVLVFGSKKLVSLGPDLGRAMRGFKQAMQGEEPGNAGAEEAGAKAGEAKGATAKRKGKAGS